MNNNFIILFYVTKLIFFFKILNLKFTNKKKKKSEHTFISIIELVTKNTFVNITR